MVLVDTNVLSELPRPRPDPAVVRWMEAQHGVLLSVVSVEEIAFGVARAAAGRRAKLAAWFDALLSAARVLPVTVPIARLSGELRAARETRGRRVAQADMLIAATAVVHGVTLATRNERDFDGCGVTVVNPFASGS